MVNSFVREMQPKNDEVAKIVSWLQDPRVNQYLEARFNPPTYQIQADLMASWLSNPDFLYLGIYVESEGSKRELIGTMKFGPYNHIHKHGELGIVIGNSNYWGLGIASKSINEAELLIKGRYDDVRKIVAGAYSANVGSVKAFLSNGFLVEGTLENHVVYGQGRTSVIVLGKLIDGGNSATLN